MINARKKTGTKWIICAGIAMIISLASPMSYGMKKQATETFNYIRSLPMELQQYILSFSDAIIFLSQQPIATLVWPNGHKRRVSSVAITGDNKVVTGSYDGTAKIWDLNTGELLHTLAGPNGHTRQVSSVAITGNNKVVTGSYDGTAKIWNLNTGELLRTLAEPDAVTSVAIAGDKVITQAEGNTAKIWDLNTGALLHTLVGHTDWVRSVAVAGDKVVTGSADETAKIWDLNTGELLHILAGHTGEVNAVAIAGDPTSLQPSLKAMADTVKLRRAGKVVTGSGDRTAKIWDLNTGTLLHTLVGHTSLIGSVAVAGDKVVTGSYDNTAKIWDLNTGTLLHTLAGHTGAIYSVAITGDKVVTGSSDNTAKIWNLNTGELLRTLAGHTGWVGSIAVAGNKVVTGSQDGTAKIWSLTPLAGTPQDNPLLWIIYNASMPQWNFIDRAYEATIAKPKRDLIIAMPPQLGKIQDTDSQEQVDGNIYFSFPDAVRTYLRNRLNIRK